VKFKLRDHSGFKAEDSQIKWMNVDLKSTGEDGLYIITFSSIVKDEDITRSYKVSPVFEEGVDYETAMKEYRKKYDDFEKKKAEIEAARVESEKQQRIAIEKAEAEMKKFQEEQKAIMDREKELVKNANYLFSINTLGWNNIDRFYKDPRIKPVDIITSIDNINDFEYVNVSMLLNKEKVYFSAYRNNDGTYDFGYGESMKTSLPIGADATIFTTGIKNDKYYFAINKIKIEKKLSIIVNLSETDIKIIKDKLESEI
jgi:hypothetical protein